MKRQWIALVSWTTMAAAARGQAPATQGRDWTRVEAVLGRKGAPQPGGVIRFGFPRSDLPVTVAGVAVKPSLALGSWIAFEPAGGGVLAMGDLVLTEDEVPGVIDALEKGGVEATALHNHLVTESPRVMYLHVMGRGDEQKIATAIHEALSTTKTPLAAPNPSAAASPSTELDTAAVARTLGYHGRVNGGVYQVSIPRAERITEQGMEVPPSMGVATALNFQSTGPGNAAATGDFVLAGPEVNPVIRALRDNGITVTAIHSHLLAESPRLFFMHFWASGPTERITRGLRAAIEKMHVKRA